MAGYGDLTILAPGQVTSDKLADDIQLKTLKLDDGAGKAVLLKPSGANMLDIRKSDDSDLAALQTKGLTNYTTNVHIKGGANLKLEESGGKTVLLRASASADDILQIRTKTDGGYGKIQTQNVDIWGDLAVVGRATLNKVLYSGDLDVMLFQHDLEAALTQASNENADGRALPVYESIMFDTWAGATKVDTQTNITHANGSPGNITINHATVTIDDFEDGDVSDWVDHSGSSGTPSVESVAPLSGNHSIKYAISNNTINYWKTGLGLGQVNVSCLFKIDTVLSNAADNASVNLAGMPISFNANGEILFNNSLNAGSYLANTIYELGLIIEWSQDKVYCFLDGAYIGVVVPGALEAQLNSVRVRGAGTGTFNVWADDFKYYVQGTSLSNSTTLEYTPAYAMVVLDGSNLAENQEMTWIEIADSNGHKTVISAKDQLNDMVSLSGFNSATITVTPVLCSADGAGTPTLNGYAVLFTP